MLTDCAVKNSSNGRRRSFWCSVLCPDALERYNVACSFRYLCHHPRLYCRTRVHLCRWWRPSRRESEHRQPGRSRTPPLQLRSVERSPRFRHRSARAAVVAPGNSDDTKLSAPGVCADVDWIKLASRVIQLYPGRYPAVLGSLRPLRHCLEVAERHRSPHCRARRAVCDTK